MSHAADNYSTCQSARNYILTLTLYFNSNSLTLISYLSLLTFSIVVSESSPQDEMFAVHICPLHSASHHFDFSRKLVILCSHNVFLS